MRDGSHPRGSARVLISYWRVVDEKRPPREAILFSPTNKPQRAGHGIVARSISLIYRVLGALRRWWLGWLSSRRYGRPLAVLSSRPTLLDNPSPHKLKFCRYSLCPPSPSPFPIYPLPSLFVTSWPGSLQLRRWHLTHYRRQRANCTGYDSRVAGSSTVGW
jgi:hypothetical protein